MNKFSITVVAAAISLAFSAGALAQAVSKDENKPAGGNPAAATTKHEAPGAYFDDSVITTKVKAAVLKEPSLKSAEINVETYKGVVQLTGFVSSRASINKAVKIARSVKGVKSVKNDMIVKGQQ
jgi:osmotically-inducible protein OsmY